MNWGNERWVKLYTRSTPDWCCLSVAARGLFCLILREVNKNGVIELGKQGVKGLSYTLRTSFDEIKEPLKELVADGCVKLIGSRMELPNFAKAQEARQSNSLSCKRYREKQKDIKSVDNNINDVENDRRRQTATDDLSSILLSSSSTSKKRRKKPPPKPGKYPLEVSAVWSAYQKYHPASDLDDDRVAIIEKALERTVGNPLQDILDAIHGNHIDPWYCGENDRKKKYNDISVILKNNKNIEDFCELWRTTQAKKANGSSRPRQCYRCGQPAHDGECKDTGPSVDEVRKVVAGLSDQMKGGAT